MPRSTAGAPSPVAAICTPDSVGFASRPDAMRLPLELLAELGCDRLILTNAAGSLREDIPSLVEATVLNALRRWFAVLFSENWALVGRFRRLLAILLNGRGTIVRFAPPVSLRDTVDEGLEPERTVRKLSRVLRTHFRRIRAAVIGPDLSTRRMLIDRVLASDRRLTGYHWGVERKRAMLAWEAFSDR